MNRDEFAGNLRNYNGKGSWSVEMAQERYREYCFAFQVKPSRSLTSRGHNEGDVGRVYGILYEVILAAFISCLVAIQLIGCTKSSAPLHNNLLDGQDEIAQTEAVYITVANIARSHHSPAIVQFSGECREGIPVLKVKVGNVSRMSGSGFDTFTQMFAGDKYFHVTTDHGIVYIGYDDVDRTILNTRLTNFTVPRDETYDPNAIISAVMRSHEISTQLKMLHMSPVIHSGGLSPVPSSSTPRLNDDLRNLTVFQVMEHLLNRFGGVVVIASCRSDLNDGKFELTYE